MADKELAQAIDREIRHCQAKLEHLTRIKDSLCFHCGSFDVMGVGLTYPVCLSNNTISYLLEGKYECEHYKPNEDGQ